MEMKFQETKVKKEAFSRNVIAFLFGISWSVRFLRPLVDRYGSCLILSLCAWVTSSRTHPHKLKNDAIMVLYRKSRLCVLQIKSSLLAILTPSRKVCYRYKCATRSKLQLLYNGRMAIKNRDTPSTLTGPVQFLSSKITLIDGKLGKSEGW